MRMAFNAIEFLKFDLETGNYSSEIEGYQEVANQLNSDRRLNKIIMYELKVLCPKALNLSLHYGNHTIHRKEKPVLRVKDTMEANSTTVLHCRAYGHYPAGISMTWDRNGQQVIEEEVERLTLPLPDQTYVSFLSVNVTPMAGDIYTCKVTHSSLQTPLTFQWEVSGLSEDDSSHYRGDISSGAVIAISLAVVLLVSVTFFSFVIWESNRRARMVGEIFHNASDA
ncbi:major histocompatibility complex class I-related gene protein-like [Bombina bombina]|uniref:major histocompatibility complex class I-related gene protein-like n=1 Tax=Bombina bombina TaxID=8345 RepID=UPI00235AA023|nr:major histocompatibility complex class I-related gene protein-like [Bombina bombina]